MQTPTKKTKKIRSKVTTKGKEKAVNDYKGDTDDNEAQGSTPRQSTPLRDIAHLLQNSGRLLSDFGLPEPENMAAEVVAEDELRASATIIGR